MQKNIKQKAKDHFNKSSGNWTGQYRAKNYNAHVLNVRKHHVLRFVDECGIKGAKILDAGCGTGEISLELIKRGYDVFGIDIALNMIRETKQRIEEETDQPFHFLVGDISSLPFNNSFDIVCCVGITAYLENIQQTIAELVRVIKPEGYLIITIRNKYSISSMLNVVSIIKRCIGRLGWKCGIERSEWKCYSPWWFEHLLRKSGFELVESIGHGFAIKMDKRCLFSTKYFLIVINKMLEFLSSFCPWLNLCGEMYIVKAKKFVNCE
ncbi:MAG: class I SAM-dependent methyltransferase [bacterium]|nr:class I SAM-dependent methyltransferase [bacterium]